MSDCGRSEGAGGEGTHATDQVSDFSLPSRPASAQQQQQQRPDIPAAATGLASEPAVGSASEPRPSERPSKRQVVDPKLQQEMVALKQAHPILTSVHIARAFESTQKQSKRPSKRQVIEPKLQQEIAALKQAHPVLTSAHIARAVSKLYGVPIKESQVEMIILRSTVDHQFVKKNWTKGKRTRYKNAPLEEALVRWVRETRERADSDPANIIKGVKRRFKFREIQEYAMKLGPSYGIPASFRFSGDWLKKVLQENGLSRKGEEISREGGEGSGNDEGFDQGGSPGSENPKLKRAYARSEIPFEIRLRYEIAVVKRARPHLENKVIAAAIRAKYGVEMTPRAIRKIGEESDKWFRLAAGAVDDPEQSRMEEALAEWVIIEEETEKREVTREEIIAQAKEIGPGFKLRREFRYGKTWATGFMKRFGLLLLSETSTKDDNTEDGGGEYWEEEEEEEEDGGDGDGEAGGDDGGLVSFVNLQMRAADRAARQVLHETAGAGGLGAAVAGAQTDTEGAKERGVERAEREGKKIKREGREMRK
ncbi:hypothetical protein CLOP_g23854 [Closterium sp. NIES-67]|nr:hypothetical protein CLOP_g23854 [Closterium sp. NIES-67]